MARPSLYDYLDYRAYLRDWFEAKKAANPRYSHRVFVRRTGRRSPSVLKHVIDGKRNLTPETTDGFTKALGLDEEEAVFFAALVQLNQATTAVKRNAAWAVIAATKRFKEARQIEGEGFEYLSHWYYPAIREMALLDDFEGTVEWIGARIRPTLEPSQIERALEVLQSLGLLVPNEHGVLEARDASVVTPHEVAGIALHNYHEGMIDRGRLAIDAFDKSERHYVGVTVAVPRSMVSKLKRELNAVQERLLDMCDSAEGDIDQVLQINLHFFPLSAPPTEGSS